MPAPATRAMEARRQREGGLQVAGIHFCGRKARHEWRRAVEAAQPVLASDRCAAALSAETWRPDTAAKKSEPVCPVKARRPHQKAAA